MRKCRYVFKLIIQIFFVYKVLTFNEIGETSPKKPKLSFVESPEHTNSDELQANKLGNKISTFKETKRTDCSADNNYVCTYS